MSSKENRAYYLSRGLCPRCGGKNRVQDGRCLCIECQQKHDTEQNKRRNLWRESGRCTRCGRERDGEKKLCPKCREYMSDIRHQGAKKAKDRRDKLRMLGLCTVCGATWAEPGHVLCKRCAEKHRRHTTTEAQSEKKRERRQQRIDAGLCIDCGRVNDTKGLRCSRCTEMRRDSTRKYQIKRRIAREAEQARRASV